MDVPHHAYLKLKMLGPFGRKIIHGSFTCSDNCDREFSKLNESFGMQKELAQLKELTDTNIIPKIQKTAPEMSFDSSGGTRAH
jgi:hypothetical protein